MADDPLARPVLLALYHAGELSDQPATLRYRIERQDGGWIALAPGRPPYGPARLEEVFTFLEWRATEDLLASAGAVFLHAAGLRVGRRNVLLVGDSGAGKSTLAAFLLTRGHLAWGDDLVRFAPEERRFSAVPRSWKVDAKTLENLYLLSRLGADGAQGMVLASNVAYVSPATLRRRWRAPDGPVHIVVLLDAASHKGPAALERASDGAAGVTAARMLIGADVTRPGSEQADLMVRVLEAMREVRAYRARGADPAGLAVALEREAAA